jgi:hypothetical protein
MPEHYSVADTLTAPVHIKPRLQQNALDDVALRSAINAETAEVTLDVLAELAHLHPDAY